MGNENRLILPYKVTSMFPPTLVKLSGQTYAKFIGCDTWFEIDDNVTRSEVEEFWIKERILITSERLLNVRGYWVRVKLPKNKSYYV